MTHLTSTSVVNRLWRPRFSSVILAAYVIAAVHSARALELPDQPLLSEASVAPNIMLMMDNSGSMDWYAMGLYDSTMDYADCPANLALTPFQSDPNQEIRAKIDSNGMAYFTYASSSRRGPTRSKNYQWGTQVTGNETYDVACFDDGQISGEDILYNLFADTVEESSLEYTGNALNYYFSNDTQSGPDYWTGTRKIGTDKRIDITKRAGESLLESLSNKRIGLAAFNQGSKGDGAAEILVGIDDIDATVAGKIQRDIIIDQLLKLEPYGGTPIGESMSDITRYFITGYENNPLTLHPNNPDRNPPSAKGSAIFSGTPAYAAGVKKPNSGSKAVIQESCQQNFVIALTDGEPQETGRISAHLTGLGPNRTSGSSSNGYDASQVNSIEYNFNAFHDVGSLNDVTLAMFDMDLRPDLNSDEPINISTYFVGGFVESLSDNEVLMSAAKNGVDPSSSGQIYAAYNQTEVEDAFDTIFGLIGSNSGARNSVAFNAASIETDTLAYQATYNNVGYLWEGDLVAYEPNTTTSGAVFGTTRAWSANDLLTTRVADVLPGADGRDIITLSKAQSGARDGIAFTTTNFSSFSAEMQADLDGDGSDTGITAKVVNYLRGAEFEGEFRERITDEFGILGDIVHSTPVEVGAPELDYPDYEAGTLSFGSAAKPYYKFENSNKNRDSVVYVGANDGMLHAFSGGANGGKELFAYIPSMLADSSSEIEGLFYLTDTTYQHKFYVDGNIGVSDVFIDPSGGTSRAWRTALFGTLGLGGKGIYALDVTDPSSFDEAKASDMVLWEFDGGNVSSAGDPDMGYIFGEPKISMMNDGRFAVIVGNGANSTNGKAVLFILFIEEGADGSWDVGDWIELDTGVAGDNGLMTPTLIDLNDDRVVDRIYAGDLKGNMWSFDVSNKAPKKWSIAHGNTGSPSPLFSAKNSLGNPQPITTAPLVVMNQETPESGNEPNALILFGTGQLIQKTDVNDKGVQSFYAVWDSGDGSLARSDLLERKMNTNVDLSREFESASPYSDPVDWFGTGSDKEYGWFMDLPDSGERVSIEPRLFGNTVFFLSSIPQSTPCSGSGYGYLNFLTAEGTATKAPIFDMDGDGALDDDDQGFVSIILDDALQTDFRIISSGDAADSSDPCKDQIKLETQGADGSLTELSGCGDREVVLGRMSWQELFGQ